MSFIITFYTSTSLFIIQFHLTVLSSVDKLYLNTHEEIGKSFMDIMKRRDPKPEPWGTRVGLQLMHGGELAFPIETYCFLSVKWDLY